MGRRLIVGLGNPGKKYQNHRHNVGFQVLDELAKRERIRLWRRSCSAQVGRGNLAGQSVVLAKPQTFMNRSGDAVAPLLKRYGCAPESLIVVHDDLDLSEGRIKLKQGGGHGGHNGLRSIIEQCGSADFIRVRVGIGRPEGDEDPADYVLRNFSRWVDARAWIEAAADMVESLLQDGLSETMNRYH